MQMKDVGPSKQAAKQGGGGSAKEPLARAREGQLVKDNLSIDSAKGVVQPRWRGRIATVGQHVNFVAKCRLGVGQPQGGSWWAASGGIESRDRVEDEHVRRMARSGVARRLRACIMSRMADSRSESKGAPSGAFRLAIIANAPAPYRTHFHRRIAREIPNVELWSAYTHETSNSPWSETTDALTRPVWFGRGERAGDQGAVSRQPHEWRKGGNIVGWLHRLKIDAVVIGGYNDLGRIRIIFWCWRHGVPCFLWADSNVRGDLAGGIKAWIKRVYIRWVVKRCAAVLPCGSLGRAYFLKYGADPTKIHYSPCEPDYELIQNLPQDKIATTRERFDLNPGRRRIVFSGRLVLVKRVDLLVDAFAAIAAERPEWDLVIVGDGPLKAGLDARVPANLRRRVTWLGFIDDQDAVSAVYRNCDVLALPSDYEPWALVINEAAAAGLAIVASDAVGAAAELVRDGVNGGIFPSGSLQALTERLMFVTEPERIETLKAGSAAVLAEWRKVADPVEGLRQALASALAARR